MGAADKLTLHRKYKVSSADADMFKRLRPGAMINFIIQAAIDSADELGFGFADIETRQLFWVLSRMTMEIYKTPVWYDEVYLSRDDHLGDSLVLILLHVNICLGIAIKKVILLRRGTAREQSSRRDHHELALRISQAVGHRRSQPPGG